MFKSLAISKVVHLLLITKLHNNTIDLMYEIQKNFIWQGKNNTNLDTKAHMFQYKVSHNTSYVNKMLFKFGKVISP